MSHMYIQPSEDFTQRTMTRIYDAWRRREVVRGLLIIGLAAVPLASRFVWLIVRRDYFSVGSWPMAHYIVGAYDFFLSPLAVYAFGIVASIAVVAFFMRNLRGNLLNNRIAR